MPSYFHSSIRKILKNKLESTLFVGNKYRASDFLKKQRNKKGEFLLVIKKTKNQ